jgi:hypothetical protein
MSLLPTDLPSFLWGAGLGLLGAFFAGFLQQAGEHAYSAIHSKLFPEPPKPIEVDRRFEPVLYKLGGCAWVSEVDIPEFEDKGFTHYPHPSGAPKCYRNSSNGRTTFKEFLMVRPGAEKNA